MTTCKKCNNEIGFVCCDPQCPQALAVQIVTSAARKFVTGEDKLVEVDYTFIDDHIIGCVAMFGQNKVRIAFQCCGWEMVASLKFANEAPTAYQFAKDQLDAELADGDDGEFFEAHDTYTWDVYEGVISEPEEEPE